MSDFGQDGCDCAGYGWDGSLTRVEFEEIEGRIRCCKCLTKEEKWNDVVWYSYKYCQGCMSDHSKVS
jgi:hypothetical protein